MAKREYFYPTKELPLEVNYNLSVEELLAQAGINERYQYNANAWTSDNFPATMQGCKKLTAVIICITTTYKTRINAILDRMELRPATIHELLAYAIKYGKKHPEISEISAWGSVLGPFKTRTFECDEFGPRLTYETSRKIPEFHLFQGSTPRYEQKYRDGQPLPYGKCISGTFLMIKVEGGKD